VQNLSARPCSTAPYGDRSRPRHSSSAPARRAMRRPRCRPERGRTAEDHPAVPAFPRSRVPTCRVRRSISSGSVPSIRVRWGPPRRLTPDDDLRPCQCPGRLRQPPGALL